MNLLGSVKSEWKGQYVISEEKLQGHRVLLPASYSFPSTTGQRTPRRSHSFSMDPRMRRQMGQKSPLAITKHVIKQEIRVWNFKPLRLVIACHYRKADHYIIPYLAVRKTNKRIVPAEGICFAFPITLIFFEH